MRDDLGFSPVSSRLVATVSFFAERAPRARRIRDWLLLAVCAALMGCAGLVPTYEGTPARPANRLPLKAMDGKADEWRTRDVAIHYTASVTADELRITGTVERLNTIKHFSAVKYFRISIHFITTDGVIIASKRLWTAGPGIDSTIIRWTFAQHYALPPETAAIGFSYRGIFSEGGSDNGEVGWEAWERP
jgi:hypothetical protein